MPQGTRLERMLDAQQVRVEGAGMPAVNQLVARGASARRLAAVATQMGCRVGAAKGPAPIETSPTSKDEAASAFGSVV